MKSLPLYDGPGALAAAALPVGKGKTAAVDKDNPLGAWGSMLPLLVGSGALIAAMAGSYGGWANLLKKKGKKKMTKLEKACVAFAVAIGERVQEMEKAYSDLQDKLFDTERKVTEEKTRADLAEARAKDAARLRDEAETKLQQAAAKIRELERGGPPVKKHHRGRR